MKACRIQFFGGFSINAGEKRLARLRTQRAIVLLAILCRRPLRSHPRDLLIETLWPEVDTESGRNRLNTEVSGLRRSLRDFEPGLEEMVSSDRFSVWLKPDDVLIDAVEFEKYCAAVEREDRVQNLEAAIELYHGPFLSGFYEECLSAEQSRLHELFIRAGENLIQLHEEQGEYWKAIECARRFVRAEPLSEGFHRDLMRLYAAAGRPTESLKQFAEVTRLLKDGLAISPSQATLDLAERIRTEPRTSPEPKECSPDGDLKLAQIAIEPVLQNHHIAPIRRKRGYYRAVGVFIALSLFLVLSHGGPLQPKTKVIAANVIKSGDAIWTARYVPAEDELDAEPVGIAQDGLGCVVTGMVQTKHNDTDFLTVKYGANGDVLWRQRFNGAGNDVDRARKVVVDVEDNVFVAGDSNSGKGNNTTEHSYLDVVTIKYDKNGGKLWVATYNNDDDGEDTPVKIWPDDRGGVLLLACSRFRKHGRIGCS